jgi:phage-related tail protein
VASEVKDAVATLRAETAANQRLLAAQQRLIERLVAAQEEAAASLRTLTESIGRKPADG